jgi:integrase
VIQAIIPVSEKPERPKDFPLFAHASGQWAKKVRGRLRYFGVWSDPPAALRKWNAQKADLLAGRVPRPVGPAELLLHELLNAFLVAKKALLAQGQIVERSWEDYLATCKRLVRVFSRETPVGRLGPEDFQRLRADMAKTWGPTRIGTEIRRCRMPFAWGVANGYIPHVPRYGEAMRRPSAKVLRKHRASKGKRMFEAAQIQTILAQAGPTIKAMTLLGINAGLGNQDVALLRKKNLDLKTGWLDFPRPKTGIPRRVPLWPETIAALRRVLKLRKKRKENAGKEDGQAAAQDATPAVAVVLADTPETAVDITTPEIAGGRSAAKPGSISPADGAAKAEVSAAPGRSAAKPGSISPPDRRRRQWRKLVFLTKHQRPWTSKTGSPVSIEFGRLLRRVALARDGLNFYALRHTFQTVADGARDPQATSAIMAHVPRSDDMSAVYREQIDDRRLQAIVDHVHAWLFKEEEKDAKQAGS